MRARNVSEQLDVRKITYFILASLLMIQVSNATAVNLATQLTNVANLTDYAFKHGLSVACLGGGIFFAVKGQVWPAVGSFAACILSILGSDAARSGVSISAITTG